MYGNIEQFRIFFRPLAMGSKYLYTVSGMLAQEQCGLVTDRLNMIPLLTGPLHLNKIKYNKQAVNCSGTITSVGEVRVIFSAIVYL